MLLSNIFLEACAANSFKLSFLKKDNNISLKNTKILS